MIPPIQLLLPKLVSHHPDMVDTPEFICSSMHPPWRCAAVQPTVSKTFISLQTLCNAHPLVQIPSSANNQAHVSYACILRSRKDPRVLWTSPVWKMQCQHSILPRLTCKMRSLGESVYSNIDFDMQSLRSLWVTKGDM